MDTKIEVASTGFELSNAGTMLSQLIYKATQLGAFIVNILGSFVPVKGLNELKKCIY